MIDGQMWINGCLQGGNVVIYRGNLTISMDVPMCNLCDIHPWFMSWEIENKVEDR